MYIYYAATTFFPQLLQQWPRLITTNLVIAESDNLRQRRLGHPAAMKFLASLQKSPRLSKVYADSSLELRAEEILRR